MLQTPKKMKLPARLSWSITSKAPETAAKADPVPVTEVKKVVLACCFAFWNHKYSG